MEKIDFSDGVELTINTTQQEVLIILRKALQEVELEEWGILRVERVDHHSGAAFSILLHTDRGSGSLGLIFLEQQGLRTSLRIPPGRGSTVPFTSFAMDPEGVLFSRYLVVVAKTLMELGLTEIDWPKRWLGLLAPYTARGTQLNGDR